MATTVKIPLSFVGPGSNCWWGQATVGSRKLFGAYFRRDVDGQGEYRGLIPQNVAATPNAGLILGIAANATSGVTRLNAKVKVVSDGDSLATALTAETAQDITVPGTANSLKLVTFPTSGNLSESMASAAGKDLEVELVHEGAHANDTLAAETVVLFALLRIDVG